MRPVLARRRSKSDRSTQKGAPVRQPSAPTSKGRSPERPGRRRWGPLTGAVVLTMTTVTSRHHLPVDLLTGPAVPQS